MTQMKQIYTDFAGARLCRVPTILSAVPTTRTLSSDRIADDADYCRCWRLRQQQVLFVCLIGTQMTQIVQIYTDLGVSSPRLRRG
jgi:hypothetical protein